MLPDRTDTTTRRWPPSLTHLGQTRSDKAFYVDGNPSQRAIGICGGRPSLYGYSVCSSSGCSPLRLARWRARRGPRYVVQSTNVEERIFTHGYAINACQRTMTDASSVWGYARLGALARTTCTRCFFQLRLWRSAGSRSTLHCLARSLLFEPGAYRGLRCKEGPWADDQHGRSRPWHVAECPGLYGMC